MMPDKNLPQVKLNAGYPRVAILMCTYNGASYIQEQLDSFGEQTFTNWTLYVSDDASTDQTRGILSDYQRRWGENRVVIFGGPCKGFAENFISLIQRPEVKGDYFAFSDQDDVWFSDKLERSLARIQPITTQGPALYCSRTRLVDADGKVIGLSPLFRKPPSFQNALVQSLAGANTMLINQAARNLLRQLPEHTRLVAHDWLAYLLVTGCGGRVIYDTKPSVDYRQHGGNLIGANATFIEGVIRLRKMLSGRFIQWNDANLNILHKMEILLAEENRIVLNYFSNGRKEGFFKLIYALRQAGIYRQTMLGNISLFLAVCLGRF